MRFPTPGHITQHVERPRLSAVLWASGTSWLSLACKSTLTTVQPSPLPDSVSEGLPSLVPAVTTEQVMRASMVENTGFI